MPEISVIIPTYNRTAMLKQAIESVQTQTCKDFEIVVVNDGFEDATADMVRQNANCRYVGIKHSGLPAVARNAGMRVTDSKFLAFLDSDDEWLPHKLETQLRIMTDPSCGLVCSNAFLADSSSQPGTRYLKPDQGATGKVLARLLSDNFVITSTVLLNRALLERVGGFCEDPDLRGMEDYDLWLRMARAAEFHYLPEPLAVYRRSADSLSGKTSELRHWRGMSAVFTRAASVMDESDPTMNSIVQRQIDACRRAMCDAYLRQRRYGSFAISLGGFCLNRPIAAAKYVASKAAKRQ